MIQENGKVYLLKPGQDWDTVKDNPAMKENAHSYAKESFQRARQDIMTVKNVIGHHKGLENDIHGRRIQATHDLIKANAAEKELAANQIRLLQSAQADARAALRPQPQPNPAMTNMAPTMQLKPTVTPTVTKTSAPSPSPRPAPTIQVFKEHVEKLRRASSITQADLMNLTNEMPGAANQANARQYIESLLASGAKFSSASPQRRAQLLDRMEQLGIQTPFRHQQEVPTQEPRKSPTPFNTTPSPYK